MESVLIRLLYPTLSKVLGQIKTTVIDPSVEIDLSESLKAMEKGYKKKPDGIYQDVNKDLVYKKDGKLVAALSWIEPIVNTKPLPLSEMYDRSSRIDGMWVDPAYRGKGVGKELLLYAIRKFGIVESNMMVSPGGEALWRSINGEPDIKIKYSKGKEHGHLAWLKSLEETVLSKVLAKAKPKVEITEYMEGDPIPKEAVALIPKTDSLRNYINKDPEVQYKWVAFLGGKPVGVATLEGMGIHGLHLGDTTCVQVIVSPKARGQGIGEKLIELAIENNPTSYLAGYTHHSDGFNHLAKKYGIRDMDDVSRYEEDSENWQEDGSYEEPEE